MDLHSKQLWRKTAFMGVFLALAMICSYIEMLIPFDFGIPGIKLGLTNIVVVLMLYSIGTKEAFCVSVIRIFLVGILFGNLIGILYSLGGNPQFSCDGTLKKRKPPGLYFRQCGRRNCS